MLEKTKKMQKNGGSFKNPEDWIFMFLNLFFSFQFLVFSFYFLLFLFHPLTMQKPSAVIGDWAFVCFSACIGPAGWVYAGA